MPHLRSETPRARLASGGAVCKCVRVRVVCVERSVQILSEILSRRAENSAREAREMRRISSHSRY